MKFIAIVAVALLLAGCNSIYTTNRPDIKVTTISATPLLAPANTITIVERPGKEDVVYASNDRSFLGIVAPAVIGAAGTVIATGQGRCSNNCGDFYVSSGSSSISTTDTEVQVKVK